MIAVFYMAASKPQGNGRKVLPDGEAAQAVQPQGPSESRQPLTLAALRHGGSSATTFGPPEASWALGALAHHQRKALVDHRGVRPSPPPMAAAIMRTACAPIS